MMTGDLPVETLSVALPESLKSFVQERIADGGYGSVSDYVRELIQADQKRRHNERIDELLIEGIKSGRPIEATRDYWDEKQRKLAARLPKPNGP